MKKNSLILLAVLLGLRLWGEDSFRFVSDQTNAVLTEGKEKTILRGNAYIQSDATEISADEIELFGEDFQYALCNGNVRVKNEEQGIIIHSQSLFYDRENELTRIQGYNEMEDFKNELIVKSNFLEDHGNGVNISYIQIGVRILKVSDEEEMICTAEFAIYRRDEDLLELTGFPEVNWKGDLYKASKILIDLETDEITMEGSVSGTIYRKEEESSEEGAEDGPEKEGESQENQAPSEGEPGREEPDPPIEEEP